MTSGPRTCVATPAGTWRHQPRNPRARIFCHRFEAELLAIGAYYKTADEIEESLRNGPVQAWLDGKTLRISAIN